MDLLWTIPILMLAFIPFAVLLAVAVITVIGLILMVYDRRQAHRVNPRPGLHREGTER